MTKPAIVRATSGTGLDALRLLHAGAGPNGSGENGPFIYWQIGKIFKRSSMLLSAHLVFCYGAQPFRINEGEETAVNIWVKANCYDEGMQSIAWTDAATPSQSF